MRFMWCFVIAVPLLAGIGVADSGNEYYINLSAKMTDESGRTSSGSGGFTAPERTFGRVGFTMYENVCNFRISSSGATAIPVTRISKDEYPRVSGDDINLMLDYYLLPRATHDKRIHITGYLVQMERVPRSHPAAFRYTEHPIDVTVSNQESLSLALPPGSERHNIEVELCVRATTEIVYKPKILRYMDINSTYSLINEDSNRVEVNRSGCHLGMPIDGGPGGGSCAHHKVFRLPDSTILVYYSVQTIDAPIWNDDGTITFDFKVLQAYAVNPEDTTASYEEISTSQKTETLLSKTVTTRPGERTIIDVPFDRDSPLPFAGRETFVIENIVTTREF